MYKRENKRQYKFRVITRAPEGPVENVDTRVKISGIRRVQIIKYLNITIVRATPKNIITQNYETKIWDQSEFSKK